MRNNSGFIIHLIILLIILTSACGNPTSHSPENTNIPSLIPSDSPGAVQILKFDTSPTPHSTQSLPTTTPTPTGKLLPALTQTTISINAATVASANSKPACTNRAEFIQHLATGDFTKLLPGVYFAKVWQIRNTGTCVWTQDYKLIFSDGSTMDGPQSVPLSQDVAPEETADLRINLIAPNQIGVHTGNWLLQDNHGVIFGFGETGDQPLSVTIVTVPTPEPTSGCAKCRIDIGN